MSPIIYIAGLIIFGIMFLQAAVAGHLYLGRGARTSPITNGARLFCLLLAACFGGLAVLVFIKNFK